MAPLGVLIYSDRPIDQWFINKPLQNKRWLLCYAHDLGYKFFVNPSLPDAKDQADHFFSLIRPFVLSYLAIKNLSSKETASFASTEEAIEYVMKVDDSGVRRREEQRTKITSTFPAPTSQADDLSIKENRRARSGFQKLAYYIQEDLTIWIFNLVIYLSCAIVQRVTFSPTKLLQPGLSEWTSSNTHSAAIRIDDILLSIRTASNRTLGTRYKAWFFLAAILPIVSFGVLRWNSGVNGLLGFAGTAMTGFLQVLLAVDIKGSKFLP